LKLRVAGRGRVYNRLPMKYVLNSLAGFYFAWILRSIRRSFTASIFPGGFTFLCPWFGIVACDDVKHPTRAVYWTGFEISWGRREPIWESYPHSYRAEFWYRDARTGETFRPSEYIPAKTCSYWSGGKWCSYWVWKRELR
jgi:hypothetical protein